MLNHKHIGYDNEFLITWNNREALKLLLARANLTVGYLYK